MDRCTDINHCILKSHGGKYSCCYCEGACDHQVGVTRTFGRLRQRNAQFLASGGKLKDASKHANVIHQPIIEEDDATPVIKVAPPCQLHLFIGGVMAPVKLIIAIYGREFLEKWMRPLGIIFRGYHGGSLDGNNAKRLLDNLDSLSLYLPSESAPIIETLRALRRVVKGKC